jgi:hypothetical protein
MPGRAATHDACLLTICRTEANDPGIIWCPIERILCPLIRIPRPISGPLDSRKLQLYQMVTVGLTVHPISYAGMNVTAFDTVSHGG